MLSAGETELGTAISQLDQQLRETEKRTRAAIAEMEATCDRLESAIKACRRRPEGAGRGPRSPTSRKRCMPGRLVSYSDEGN